MSEELLQWDIYEINSQDSSLNGVMLRGRIRKLGIENGFNVLAENTEDSSNGVRFAVLNDHDANIVTTYLKSIIEDVQIRPILKATPNPVLSKLKVNMELRYTL